MVVLASRSKYSENRGKIGNVAADGISSWWVAFDLVIAFESAVMTFSLEMDGETLGAVEARFEH